MTEHEAAALIQALPEDMREELKRRMGEAVIALSDAVANLIAEMFTPFKALLEELDAALADLAESLEPKPKARISTKSFHHNYQAVITARGPTVGMMRQHTAATGM